MGNGHDHRMKHDCGYIYLQTGQSSYAAGEIITGNAYLYLTSMFPAEEVEIKIKGKELTKWRERKVRYEPDENGNQREVVEIIKHRGDKSISQRSVPIYKFPGGSSIVGQFVFPFQIKLDDDNPGSFMFIDSHHAAKAKIQYSISVFVKPHNKDHFKEMKYSQRLIVRQKMPAVMGVGTVDTQTKNLTTWCCFSKGPSTIKTSFERDTYLPSEVAKALCEIDNGKCKLKIVGTTCRLTQTVELEDDNHGRKTISSVVSSATYPGLGSGDNTFGNPQLMELLLADKKTKVGERKKKPLKAEDKHMAEMLQGSTHGSKIKCKYHLEVIPSYEGCLCCSEGPRSSILLTIVPPPPVNWGGVQAPQGWNPQVQPVFNASQSTHH